MLLAEFAIFLAAAIVAVPLFKRLGLGSVLGYLAAGAVIGPFALGLIQKVEEKMQLAEFGVVLLLFLIGLELAPARLWKMRGTVFGLGGAQMLVTGLALSGAGLALGLGWAPALVVGIALSLSSTAFVLQMLAERNELATAHGRSAFGILLFQDLAAIPMLAIVPALAGQGGVATGNPWLKALTIAGVFAGLVLTGRYLMRPLFKIIASARTQELTTALALLVVVGTALLMHEVGLSMALGAFLAGVLLAESEYRHELEADIEPFKGLLLGLFFTTVGMSVDFSLVVRSPGTVLGLVLGLTATKLGAMYLVARITGHEGGTVNRLAISLSQGGEFAFVIFGVAERSGVIHSPLMNLLVVVVSLSMVLTPLLMLLYDRWAARVKARTPQRPFDEIDGGEAQVIIAGFGRFGQIVARLLRANRISFTALEINTAQVDFVRRFGSKVYYGDASRLDLLRAAKTDKARLLVLAIDDPERSVLTAKTVLQHFPHVKIIARARNRAHVYALMALGIQNVIREAFHSSLLAGQMTLEELGLSPVDARETVRKFQEYDEEVLLQQFKFRDDEKALIATAQQSTKDLEKIFEQDARARI
jgi:monovalent cation:proton antiporter-2 (CPA2) family protein